MKKFVYFFGALLILFVTQNILGGDHDWKNKDHKGFYRSPIKIGFDANYLRSTSGYDIDGNKQDNNGGDIFSRINEIIYAKYHGGRIGDTNVKWGAGIDLSFIQEKWTPGDMNMYATGYSDNGVTITPGATVGIRRIGKLPFSTYINLKYQIDATKDESNATDRQNALGANLNFNYRIAHGSKVFLGVDYWNTLARTETQQVFNYETYQVEDMDVDYDQGNQLAIYGGGDYKWCWGDCGWGHVGLKVNYWNRSDQSYDGNTLDKSSANYLSLIPEVGFRSKKLPLSFSLSTSYRNEYGIEQGWIGLSGKNVLKPSFALEGNVRIRF